MVSSDWRPSAVGSLVMYPAGAMLLFWNCPKPWISVSSAQHAVEIGYPVVYRSYWVGLFPPPAFVETFFWSGLAFNVAFGLGLLAILWLLDWAVRSRQFSIQTVLLLMVLSGVELGMYLAVPRKEPVQFTTTRQLPSARSIEVKNTRPFPGGAGQAPPAGGR